MYAHYPKGSMHFTFLKERGICLKSYEVKRCPSSLHLFVAYSVYFLNDFVFCLLSAVSYFQAQPKLKLRLKAELAVIPLIQQPPSHSLRNQTTWPAQPSHLPGKVYCFDLKTGNISFF